MWKTILSRLNRLNCRKKLFGGVIALLCTVSSAQAATTYYVDSPGGNGVNGGGNDSNTPLQAKDPNTPWATIAASVNKLAVGDTLMVRGGTYYESRINVNCAGTSTSPITIRNYQNEIPTIDGAVRGPGQDFQTIGNNGWEVVDQPRGIYRSVNSFPNNPGVENWVKLCGGKYEFNGKTYALMPYVTRKPTLPNTTPPQIVTLGGYAWLSSDTDTYDKYNARYFGPGVCYGRPLDPNNPEVTDDRIYIRLKGVSTFSTFGHTFDFPTDPNPANVKVSLTSYERWGVQPSASSHDVIWQGINLANHNFEVRGRPGSTYTNWTFKNFTMWPAFTGFLFDAPQHDFLIDGVTINGCLPGWMAWQDVKGAETAAINVRIAGISFGGSLASSVHHVEVRNCKINDVFDAFSPGAAEHDLYLHHNTARAWDDFIQLGSVTYNIELAYNYIYGAGPSHDGSGPAVAPGTKYIHHNIIDGTNQILWVRQDAHVPPLETDAATLASFGWHGENLMLTHGGGNVGHDPWQIYHNTLIQSNNTGGYIQFAAWYPNDTGVKHEVYNNIFYLTARNYMARSMESFLGSQIYDGNVMYRPLPQQTPPEFTAFYLGVIDGSIIEPPPPQPQIPNAFNYNSLAAFKASYQWQQTKAYYAPGWDASSIELPALAVDSPTKPDLVPNYDILDYRPNATSPAATGAVNISSKPSTWHGTAYTPWRGAVPPVSDGVISGLKGYWKLDEGTGTAAADSSGLSHNGTLISSPTWRTGELGKALTFNGTLPRVEVPNHADFNFGSTTNFSIACWFQATRGCDGTILIKGNTTSNSPRYYMYVRQLAAGGVLQFNMCDGPITRTIGTAAVDDGIWHLATVTVDRAGLMKLYIDGVVSAQTSATGMGSLDATTFPVAIGQGLEGSVDDVRIFNRILSQSEIQSLYDMGSHVGAEH